MPDRRRRSGCALRHYEDECDCIRPEAAEPQRCGCPECAGCGEVRTGVMCGACGGWGEVYRSGSWISGRSFAYRPTGPSPTYSPPIEDDPWAVATGVVDALPFPDQPPF